MDVGRNTSSRALARRNGDPRSLDVHFEGNFRKPHHQRQGKVCRADKLLPTRAGPLIRRARDSASGSDKDKVMTHAAAVSPNKAASTSRADTRLAPGPADRLHQSTAILPFPFTSPHPLHALSSQPVLAPACFSGNSVVSNSLPSVSPTHPPASCQHAPLPHPLPPRLPPLRRQR